MTQRWNAIGAILRQDGNHSCLVVNALGEKDEHCTGQFQELHHGIWAAQPAHKEKEWRHFLDHPVNACPSCHYCNVSRVGDGNEARYQYLLLQIQKYGAWQVKKWLASAPSEIRKRHEWSRYMKEVS